MTTTELIGALRLYASKVRVAAKDKRNRYGTDTTAHAELLDLAVDRLESYLLSDQL